MTSRRDMLKLGAETLIWASIGGSLLQCTPQQAVAANADFRFFSAREAELLAAFVDALVPGAAKAGCAHFIDYHVRVPPAESLLMLRYLDVAPPYADFYRSGLASLDSLPETQATPREWDKVIKHLFTSPISGWNGPPPSLFYFAVRSDAIDSVYCTVEGFERLGVDYLAHISPATDW